MGCCSKTNKTKEDVKIPCPLCNTTGEHVHHLVLKEIVKKEVLSQINEETYFSCRNDECDVVFYNKYRDRIFLTQDINMKSDFSEVTKNNETGCSCNKKDNCGSCSKKNK